MQFLGQKWKCIGCLVSRLIRKCFTYILKQKNKNSTIQKIQKATNSSKQSLIFCLWKIKSCNLNLFKNHTAPYMYTLLFLHNNDLNYCIICLKNFIASILKIISYSFWGNSLTFSLQDSLQLNKSSFNESSGNSPS